MKRLIVSVSSLALMLQAHEAALGVPTLIDGVGFVDRGASGEIDPGYVRGGLSVFDYDSDGWPDLVIADNAGAPTRLLHNQPDPQHPGRRTFLDAGAGSGLDDAEGTARFSFGVVAADYDNDGDPDIYMTGAQGSSYGLLYRNDGGGTFSNVTLAAGLRGSGRSVECASWSDFDLDGDCDLMICFANGTACQLMRNNGDGTFTDASGLLPPGLAGGRVYAQTWLDYDSDGYPDCFVPISNGTGPALLKNVSDGSGGRRFENVAQAVGFQNLGPAPMGLAAGDYDGDGHLDLAITDAVNGTYFRNLGDQLVQVDLFQTIFGWGVMWIDVDNDGDVDNYYIGSHSKANIDRLHRNLGNGQFQDISAALNTTALASQHGIQIDFNNDGRPDMVTINPGSPGRFVSVYENVSTIANHWLTIRLVGNGATVNRDAIGAVVRLRAGGKSQIRELISGSSTTATEDLRVHFGLGTESAVDSIEVVWPRKGSLAARTTVHPGPIAVDQFLALSAPMPAPADFDGDGDVDGEDLAAFTSCVSGPAVAVADETCAGADLDMDGDVDHADFGLLQRCYRGPDQVVSAACAE